MPKGYTDKPRMRHGNPPSGGTLVAEHASGWALYERFTKAKGKDLWVNVKLVAAGDIPYKANYWLAYNLRTNEFCLNRDVRLLDARHPELLTWAGMAIRGRRSKGERFEDLL